MKNSGTLSPLKSPALIPQAGKELGGGGQLEKFFHWNPYVLAGNLKQEQFESDYKAAFSPIFKPKLCKVVVITFEPDMKWWFHNVHNIHTREQILHVS